MKKNLDFRVPRRLSWRRTDGLTTARRSTKATGIPKPKSGRKRKLKK